MIAKNIGHTATSLHHAGRAPGRELGGRTRDWEQWLG